MNENPQRADVDDGLNSLLHEKSTAVHLPILLQKKNCSLPHSCWISTVQWCIVVTCIEGWNSFCIDHICTSRDILPPFTRIVNPNLSSGEWNTLWLSIHHGRHGFNVYCAFSILHLWPTYIKPNLCSAFGGRVSLSQIQKYLGICFSLVLISTSSSSLYNVQIFLFYHCII